MGLPRGKEITIMLAQSTCDRRMDRFAMTKTAFVNVNKKRYPVSACFRHIN